MDEEKGQEATSAAAELGEQSQPQSQNGQPQGGEGAGVDTSSQESQHWTAGMEQDTVDYLKAKGLDGIGKDEAFDKVLNSYRNLEKKAGVPEDRLIKLPEEGDDDAMNSLYDRLGRPEDKDGYATPEGDTENDPVLGWAKEALYNAGVSKDKGEAILNSYNEMVKEMAEEVQKEVELRQEQEINDLKKEWGSHYDARIQSAREFAGAIGLSPDELNAIEHVVGSRGLLDKLYNASQSIKTDTVVTNRDMGTTPEEARGKIKLLQNEIAVDPKRLAMYNKGKGKDYEQMKNLQRLAHS